MQIRQVGNNYNKLIDTGEIHMYRQTQMSKEKKGEIPVCRILSCFAVGYTPIIPSPLPLPNTQPAQQHFPSLSLSHPHTTSATRKLPKSSPISECQCTQHHRGRERDGVCVCAAGRTCVGHSPVTFLPLKLTLGNEKIKNFIYQVEDFSNKKKKKLENASS